jgi:hypothetical protein
MKSTRGLDYARERKPVDGYDLKGKSPRLIAILRAASETLPYFSAADISVHCPRAAFVGKTD